MYIKFIKFIEKIFRFYYNRYVEKIIVHGVLSGSSIANLKSSPKKSLESFYCKKTQAGFVHIQLLNRIKKYDNPDDIYRVHYKACRI